MPGSGRALSAAALGLAMLAGGPAPARAELAVEYLGTHVWREADETFGGFSAIELTPDGSGYVALTDRASLRWGSIDRDAQGRIRDMTTAGHARLKDSSGEQFPQGGYLSDSEGLAVDGQGRIFVSFEGLDRLARYDDRDGPAVPLPRAPAFRALSINAGLEALAVTPSGDLLTIPEKWGSRRRDFPVWRLRDGEWSTPFEIPVDPEWSPVGADVGPDGRLYLLERQFRGLRGFASRVRRFALGDETLGAAELVLQSQLLQFDNLEGITVWQDGQGIRLTMISDDNFFVLQRTELVEYRIKG